MTTEAYINALLADATYALNENNSSNGQTGLSLIDALKTRMTPTLANFIGNNFKAVTHIDTSDNPLIGSGFDATVWRGIADEYAGKTYVTMTGSEDVSDLSDTDFNHPVSDFLSGNLPLAFEILSQQLKDAADYFLQVQFNNPVANIRVTEHSLVGGFAS